jgi:hypothetical protein
MAKTSGAFTKEKAYFLLADEGLDSTLKEFPGVISQGET